MKSWRRARFVSIADSFPERGEDYFQAALNAGIEGVVAKRLDSQYLPGIRSQDWIKIKKSLKLDLVVGGYIPGNGNREQYFGGLLIGAYSHGQLVYIGRVGSGFSEDELKEITGHFFAQKPVSVLQSAINAGGSLGRATPGGAGNSPGGHARW